MWAPTPVPVPSFTLRAMLRGLTDEGPLISQRVRARRLATSGFAFAHPHLEGALQAVLKRRGDA